MTDREQIVAAFAWNLRYAEELVSDLTDEEWCKPGGPGLENHPAWTLGHLVSGADILAEDLGLEREMRPADASSSNAAAPVTRACLIPIPRASRPSTR